MKFFIAALLLLNGLCGKAQELFVYSDPASNLPAKSLGFRLTNNLMDEKNTTQYRLATSPEVMIGVAKKIMFKANAMFTNMDGSMNLNGGSLYAKYRFLSNDEVHSHLRMAGYVRGSISNLHIHQPAIDLMMMNSGLETGIITTQLIKRTALSATVAYLHASDNADGNKFAYGGKNRDAVNYSLSVGRLMLPKEYTSYDQTNVNIMLEMPGQTNFATGKTFLDLAPSVQFIIKSRMRIDIGYRFALVNSLQRSSESGALLRIEYNIFNAF